MHRFLSAFAALSVLACQTPGSDLAAAFEGRSGTWIDLTHAFGEDTIYWPTDTRGFRLEELAYGRSEGGWFYAAYAFASAEHGGTHLDAPIHFAEGRHTNDQIPLASLIGPAAVVDVGARAHPDYQVTVADLLAWEAKHGRIPQGAILLLRSGWGARWPDRRTYLGTDATGPEAVKDLHFPGLHPDAARWLVEERAVDAVGIDTPSIDFGQSHDFRSHVTLFEANVPGFENLANLERLPAIGAYVVGLPMKIAGGSGGPLRIVAFVP